MLIVDGADVARLTGSNGIDRTVITYGGGGPDGVAARSQADLDTQTFAGLRIRIPPAVSDVVASEFGLVNPMGRRYETGEYVMMGGKDVMIFDDLMGRWVEIKFADALREANQFVTDAGVAAAVRIATGSAGDGDAAAAVGNSTNAAAYDVMLVRHQMCYETRAAVLARGGPEVGKTLVAFQDIKTAENVSDKTIMTHYTAHTGTVVHDSRAIMIIPEFSCAAKLGGSNARFFTPDEWAEHRAAGYQSRDKGLSRPSLVAVLFKRGSNIDPNFYELSGNVDELDPSTSDKPIANSYMFDKMMSSLDYETVGATVNTVLYRGAHYTKTPGNDGTYSVYHTGNGSFGPHVAEDCALHRSGTLGYVDATGVAKVVG
jgi:hypothetical protein